MDERVSDMTTPVSAEVPVIAQSATARPYRPDVTIEVDTGSTFERFYAGNRDAVARAVTVAIGDPAQAADSTDEAMIRAYQRWSKVGALDRPAGWVFRVAVNHSRSRFRRLATKTRHVAALDRDVHDDTVFHDSIPDASLQRAVRSLSAEQREVIVLRVLLEFTERECADALDIRPGTAKSRLHRGLAELRRAVPHLAPSIDAVLAAEKDNTP